MNRNHITSRHLSSLLRSSKGLTSEGLDCRACRALGLFSLRLPPPSKAVKSTVGVYAGWLPEKTLIPPIALRYEPTRRDNRGLILGFLALSSPIYIWPWMDVRAAGGILAFEDGPQSPPKDRAFPIRPRMTEAIFLVSLIREGSRLKKKC